MALPTLALASDSVLAPLYLPRSSSDKDLCLATLPDPLASMKVALEPATFVKVGSDGNSAVVITQAKDSMQHSFSADSTVMTKASAQDLAQDIPAPTSVTPTIDVPEVTTTVTPTGEGLHADTIFDLVNASRAQYGLAPFQKDERICDVAAARAPEISNEIWVTHTMHAGFYARNLPYWATENLISMQTEQQAVNWWLHSPVHRAALLGNWKYACVACSGTSCSMIFTNFDPKQTTQVPVSSTVITPTQTPLPSTSPTTAQTVTSLIK